MPRAPVAPSSSPDAPFKRIGGNLALDLINTCDWVGGLPVNERLTGYERLVEWAIESGVVGRAEGARLNRAAAGSPRAASAALDSARWCRWVLRRVILVAMHDTVDDAALPEFEALVRRALGAGTLVWQEGGVHWLWRHEPGVLDRLPWPVVQAAAQLLGSAEVHHLRQCGAADCGWIYLDHSRNGMRRWCEMSVCGTREKNRRRAERKRAAS